MHCGMFFKNSSHICITEVLQWISKKGIRILFLVVKVRKNINSNFYIKMEIFHGYTKEQKK